MGIKCDALWQSDVYHIQLIPRHTIAHLHKVMRHSFSLIMSQILTSKNYHTTTLLLEHCILILDEPRIILEQHSSSIFYLNNPTSQKCFNIWSQVVCSSAYTIIFILKNDTQEQKYCSFEISRKLRQCLEVMSVRKLFPKVGHDKNHKKSQEKGALE